MKMVCRVFCQNGPERTRPGLDGKVQVRWMMAQETQRLANVQGVRTSFSEKRVHAPPPRVGADGVIAEAETAAASGAQARHAPRLAANSANTGAPHVPGARTYEPPKLNSRVRALGRRFSRCRHYA